MAGALFAVVLWMMKVPPLAFALGTYLPMEINSPILVGGLIAFALSQDKPAAPAFSLTDLNGQTLSEQDFQNRVTLVNFWFPTCPGCVSEMPKLVKMDGDYRGRDFQILAISVPVSPENGLEQVRAYSEQRRLPFRVAFDAERSVSRSYLNTELYPTSVLVDKQGKVLKTYVGIPDFAALYREVDAELAK